MESSGLRALDAAGAEDRLLQELAARIAAISEADGAHDSGLPGVAGIRMSAPSGPLPAVYHPSLCIVAQGRKLVLSGLSGEPGDLLRSLRVDRLIPTLVNRSENARPAIGPAVGAAA